ncbi:MAG: ABC transporter permease [Propionibacteriaceae bacterium]|nr:ABC transporter permease [Propionibacteriaceae bacterium]
MTTALSIPHVAAPADRREHNRTFTRMIASELIKAKALPSTLWCAVLTVLLGMAITAGILGLIQHDSLGSHPLPRGIAVGLTLESAFVPIIAGCLLASVEYASNAIRTTLATTQRRVAWLGAKAVASVIIQVITQLIAVIMCAIVAVTVCAARGVSLAVEPHQIGWIALCVLGAVMLHLMGLALGMLTRSAAASITISVGIMWVLLTIVDMASYMLPWMVHVLPAVPYNALSALVGANGQSEAHTWWTTQLGGGTVCLIWLVVFSAGAAVLLKRRDA